MHISFVCTGNICRSPMAASVLGTHLQRAGIESRVRVTSAGIEPWHVGKPADARAVQVLQSAGYSSDHVAAQFAFAHHDADLIVAMDRTHHRRLSELVSDPGRIRLFRSFEASPTGDLDVPDPYHGGVDDFVGVLKILEAGMPTLMELVKCRLA
jgi:protein-tyrosine phosphatase